MNLLKTKNYNLKTDQRGVATLVNVLLISTIIMLIAIYGVIISVIFLNSAFNERLAEEALVVARSGAQDAIIRVVRYKDCPTINGCPAEYTLEVGGNTAEVKINNEGGGSIIITSTGTVLMRKKRIVAELGIDDVTGEVNVQSFKEVAI